MVAMHLMQAAQRPSICQGQAGWMGRKALKDYAHVQSTSCSARTVSAGNEDSDGLVKFDLWS